MKTENEALTALRDGSSYRHYESSLFNKLYSLRPQLHGPMHCHNNNCVETEKEGNYEDTVIQLMEACGLDENESVWLSSLHMTL